MIEDLDLEGAVARVTAARFDVCIVGAGAAGIALAVELERQGRRILLLEAGGRQVEPAAQDAYGSEVVGPIPHRGVHEGRVRALGGTTKRWGGQILELGSDDFAPRPWLPGAGWPFGKEQLTDYYGRALDFEGLGGVIPDDLPVWRRLGMAAPTFDGLEQYFSRWCPEPDFAVLHAGVLERSQRLVVLLHANAVSVRLEGEHLREIVCRGTGGTESRFSAGYFVFCLGGIETCRFFLQPLAGQRAPWTHHPALGASFQDHVDAAAAVVRPLDERRFHLLFDNIYLDGYKYHPKVRLAPPLQRRHGTLNVAGTMQFVSDVESGVRAARSVVRRAIRSRGREIGRHDARILLSHLPTVGRQATRLSGPAPSIRAARRRDPSDGALRARSVRCQPDLPGRCPRCVGHVPHSHRLARLRTRVGHDQVLHRGGAP